MNCVRKNSARIALSRDELECARDYSSMAYHHHSHQHRRPSAQWADSTCSSTTNMRHNSKGEAGGVLESANDGVPCICWDGRATTASQSRGYSQPQANRLGGASSAINTVQPSNNYTSTAINNNNFPHAGMSLPSSSSFPSSSNTNQLLRKALANRITQQQPSLPSSSKTARVKRSSAAAVGDDSNTSAKARANLKLNLSAGSKAEKTTLRTAQNKFAENNAPKRITTKNGNADYEIPPDPIAYWSESLACGENDTLSLQQVAKKAEASTNAELSVGWMRRDVELNCGRQTDESDVRSSLAVTGGNALEREYQNVKSTAAGDAPLKAEENSSPLNGEGGGAMSASILANPAWYRDNQGRTGFVPTEWISAPNLQTNAIKPNDQMTPAECVSLPTIDYGRKFLSFAPDYSPNEQPNTSLRKNDSKMGSEKRQSDSSGSELSRQSHKSVTFAKKVTEIESISTEPLEVSPTVSASASTSTKRRNKAGKMTSFSKNDDTIDVSMPPHSNAENGGNDADDELESLLEKLKIDAAGINNKDAEHNNGRSHRTRRSAAPKKNVASECATLLAEMPPRPPPRSPKNISREASAKMRAIENAMKMQNNARTSGGVAPRLPRPFIRSASGYLEDESVILREQPASQAAPIDSIRRPSVLDGASYSFESASRLRLQQDPQLSYYDNLSPTYARESLLDAKPHGSATNDVINRAHSAAAIVEMGERRKDSAYVGEDSDSHESILSATSLRAEGRVRRFFNY